MQCPHIQDGETILLDDSSVNYYLAEEIKTNPSKHIIVVTYSIVSAAVLSVCRHISLFFVGGQVEGSPAASMGEMTTEAMKQFHADKAFISAHGVNFQAGISSIGSSQMQVKKAIISAAKEIYLLVDSSKFGGSYVMIFCQMERIHTIITDRNVAPQYLEEAKQKSVRLEVV